MPAGDGDHGSMTAIKRLLRLLRAWMQRRARRRAHLGSFMGVSDRVLADIGVRRIDVYGAMAGVVPLRRTAATAEEAPPDAAVCELPPRPRLAVVANDLSAAA